MNKIFRLFFLLAFAWGGLTTSAQTLSQAKKWYEEGDYEKAKPVFARFVKSYPNNGNYNLWYGVCCLKTGDAAGAIPPLEKAVKRRTPSGQLYLGQAYNEQYRYKEAIETFEAYITDLAKRKRSTAEADSLLAISRLGLRLLRGVEEVQVIDSFVVDKQELLEAYRLSPESGTLATYQDYFDQEDGEGGTVYENELGNRLYYSALQADSTLQIFASSKLLDRWSQGKTLPDNINEAGANANYPYMLSDGMTLYYASDGKESLGGYDIFVTRYNTNSDTYLTPENVGMPFNSPYNDYLYAIDEYNNLGWFASDRYQPEGKACIYIFIPNASKQVYNYEGMAQDSLIGLARLDAIAATWKANPSAIAAAKARLQAALQDTPRDIKRHYDFEFIIDDSHTYHELNDFHSEEAKESYRQYAQAEANLRRQQHKLDDLRQQYQQADQTGKDNLTPAILDLERLTRRLDAELRQAAIEIRRLEKQHQP